jgi:hypothetical protein
MNKSCIIVNTIFGTLAIVSSVVTSCQLDHVLPRLIRADYESPSCTTITTASPRLLLTDAVVVVIRIFASLLHPIQSVTFATRTSDRLRELQRTTRLRRRISHVPNVMQMSKTYCLSSFALDSAHVRCDVWTRPNISAKNIERSVRFPRTSAS